jgi:hypothetical protein
VGVDNIFYFVIIELYADKTIGKTEKYTTLRIDSIIAAKEEINN